MLVQRIQQQFIDSADLGYQCAEALGPAVDAAIGAVQAVVTGGGKVWVHGMGAGAWLAPSFVNQFVGTFDRERPALPAVLLPNHAPVRALSALATADDLLLLIGANGADATEMGLALVAAAHERDMRVVALTGKDGGQIAHILQDQDILLNVAHQRTARIQEAHIVAIHALCDGIDTLFSGA